LSLPLEVLSELLPRATRDEIESLRWLQPQYVSDGETNVGYYSFLVETPQARLVVDTAVGNSKSRTYEKFDMLDTDYMANFRAVWDPDDVDAVVSTHLHVDHVGWNTRLDQGAWIPTFAGATYYFVESEYRYWQGFVDANDPVNAVFDAVNVFNDSIRPIVASGLASLVGADAAICPGVSLLPSHGHTPGHVSVVIESNGDRAVITGDLMHSPCQVGRPGWSSVYDADPVAAATSRRPSSTATPTREPSCSAPISVRRRASWCTAIAEASGLRRTASHTLVT
jgi:glyoxylase-like metal-dependent hydrolase (beta-lactamase superfamily II)